MESLFFYFYHIDKKMQEGAEKMFIRSLKAPSWRGLVRKARLGEFVGCAIQLPPALRATPLMEVG